MSDCLTQLNTVLSLAEAEYAALRDGDLDTAERLCAQRDSLLAEAMSNADAVSQLALCDRLLALQDIQQKLRDEAARQREEIRGQLFAAKQEARRLNGYRKSVSMAFM